MLTYRTQRRGGKGKTGARIVDDDFAERVLTHQRMIIYYSLLTLVRFMC